MTSMIKGFLATTAAAPRKPAEHSESSLRSLARSVSALSGSAVKAACRITGPSVWSLTDFHQLLPPCGGRSRVPVVKRPTAWWRGFGPSAPPPLVLVES